MLLLLGLCIGRFVAGGNPGDAADQLKALIKSLHQAGIEVLLEVREATLAVLTSGPGGQHHQLPQTIALEYSAMPVMWSTMFHNSSNKPQLFVSFAGVELPSLVLMLSCRQSSV